MGQRWRLCGSSVEVVGMKEMKETGEILETVEGGERYKG